MSNRFRIMCFVFLFMVGGFTLYGQTPSWSPIPSKGTVFSFHGAYPYYPPGRSFSYVATDTSAPYPQYMTATVGSVFSNKIMRITDYPSVRGVVLYPKTPSWNCDGALLMLSYRLLDGRSYQLIAANCWWDDDERKWSALYPHIYYAMEHNYDLDGDGVYDHAFVRRDVSPVLSGGASVPDKEVLVHFSGTNYDEMLLGKYEGNIDHRDRFVVFAAKRKNADTLTAIVFDIQSRQITTQTNLTNILWEDANGNQVLDWISVSPSGQYILIDWKKDPTNSDPDFRYSIDEYDINMNFIRELSPQGEHGDIGVGANRDDVYVQFEFGSRAGIWAYNLESGNALKLLPSKYNGGHVSCRNYHRRGWCYLSTNQEGYREVFALKMDGSGTVNRFAQTHAQGDAEGGVNARGTKIIFSSTWDGASSNSTREAFVVEAVK